MRNYRIQIASTAIKDIKHLNKQVLRKFDKAVSQLSANPFHTNTKKLTDFPYGDYRYRIGNYRIIFDIYGKTILITRVLHRKKVYKK